MDSTDLMRRVRVLLPRSKRHDEYMLIGGRGELGLGFVVFASQIISLVTAIIIASSERPSTFIYNLPLCRYYNISQFLFSIV
jgi:hypothetical protein